MMKKKILTAIILMTVIVSTMAQIKQNYQGVLRNDDGSIVSEQSIDITFEFREDNTSGTVTYAELHTVTTNEFGEFNALLGGGAAISGTASDVDFEDHDYFLNVNIDGTDMGTTVFLVSPFSEKSNLSEALYKNGSGSRATMEGTSTDASLNIEPGVDNGTSKIKLSIFGNSVGNVDQQVEIKNEDGNISFVNSGGNFVAGNLHSDTNLVVKKDGDIITRGEMQNIRTGSANLLPIAMGSISPLGAISSGTANFTVNNSAIGEYRITINDETFTYNNYIVSLSNVDFDASESISYTNDSGGVLIINIVDTLSGNPQSSAFSFIVYKL